MRPQDGKSAPITEMFVWNLLLLDYRTVLVQRFPRKEEAPPEAADAAMSGTTVAKHVARQSSFAPPRAIPAAFNPRTAALPLQSKAMSPRKAVVMRAKATQEELPSQETFVILQTAQYDFSGSGVWTLYIWRVGGENLADRQLESTVVLSSI